MNMDKYEKYKIVARNTDLDIEDTEWLILNFVDRVDEWNSYTLDEEKYLKNMSIEDMETVIRLYLNIDE